MEGTSIASRSCIWVLCHHYISSLYFGTPVVRYLVASWYDVDVFLVSSSHCCDFVLVLIMYVQVVQHLPGSLSVNIRVASYLRSVLNHRFLSRH